MVLADADRDRILATLMEEWSPLQRDLMDRLLRGEEDASDAGVEDPFDLRRARSLALARLHEAMHARLSEDSYA